MAINASSGAPYGTPIVSGTFNVTVTVTDSSSPQKMASKVLALNAKEFAIARGIADPPLLAFKRGARFAPTELSSNGATLVVASALVKGKSRRSAQIPRTVVFIVRLFLGVVLPMLPNRSRFFRVFLGKNH